MANEKFIEGLSKFTKIPESKIRGFLEENTVKNLLEHPESIKATQNQMENFNNLKRLTNLYERLSKYKEYKFEKTEDSVDFLSSHFDRLSDKEKFIVAYLDEENKLLGVETISIGTLNASIVHPRDVMKKALEYKSQKMILCHNHPSGDPTPSREDLNITMRLEEVGKLLNIQILDHIVIGNGNHYSFRENNNINTDYKLAATQGKKHEAIYKGDIKDFINLLSKVTKIPKKDLNLETEENGIKDFLKRPYEYLSDEKHIKAIYMLNEIQAKYDMAKRDFAVKIGSPTDVKRFVENEYIDYENIQVAVFLDTKNQIINTKIIPDKLSLNDKAKFITVYAILNDSNSYILVNKEDNNFLNDIPSKKLKEVNKLKDISNLVGIKLLDNIDFSDTKFNSFKEKGYISESENLDYLKSNLENHENKEEIKKVKLDNLSRIIEEKKEKDSGCNNREREVSLGIDR